MASKKVTAPDIEKPESRLKSMWDAFKKNKAALFGLFIIIFLTVIAIIGPYITPYDPYDQVMSEVHRAPSAEHWFGTDLQGRDIFSRVIVGTRVSLFVGVTAVAFALVIGTLLGSLAGYFGGKLDTVLMRLMDIMLSIPSILLAITLMAALGKGLDKAIIAIGVVSIPEYARLIRSAILSAKGNDYVAAARVIGCSDRRIIFHHIMPNVISSIVVRATLGISGAILDTAALGFLGLGVQPPMAEWGDMLGRVKDQILVYPYMLIFPGLAITLAVFAFNLFGDGLRDALDPKSRT